MIVLAIRHGQIVNRLSTTVVLPDGIDASTISAIVLDGTEPRTYRVYIGHLAGTVLTVRIVDGKVELHHYSIWTVYLNKTPLAIL